MYYHDSIKEVAKKFNTNLECGLNTAQVQQKTHPTFKNQLEEKKRKSWFLVFLSQLTDPLIYILGVAFIISLLLKEVVDAFIILSVVILNAIIGSVGENVIPFYEKVCQAVPIGGEKSVYQRMI